MPTHMPGHSTHKGPASHMLASRVEGLRDVPLNSTNWGLNVRFSKEVVKLTDVFSMAINGVHEL